MLSMTQWYVVQETCSSNLIVPFIVSYDEEHSGLDREYLGILGSVEKGAVKASAAHLQCHLEKREGLLFCNGSTAIATGTYVSVFSYVTLLTGRGLRK